MARTRQGNKHVHPTNQPIKNKNKTHFGVDSNRLGLGVLDGVTSLVIARVLCHTRARVQAANGLAGVHEGLVVATTREDGRRDVDALAGVVVDEELLDYVAAWRAGQAVRASVAVEDAEVALAYHVDCALSQRFAEKKNVWGVEEFDV